MKIRTVEADLFHADRQTERCDETNSHFSRVLRRSLIRTTTYTLNDWLDEMCLVLTTVVEMACFRTQSKISRLFSLKVSQFCVHHTDNYANMRFLYFFFICQQLITAACNKAVHKTLKKTSISKPKISYSFIWIPYIHVVTFVASNLQSIVTTFFFIVAGHQVTLQATIISSGQFKSLYPYPAISPLFLLFCNWISLRSFIHSFIQYSVWRQVQSLLQNNAST